MKRKQSVHHIVWNGALSGRISAIDWIEWIASMNTNNAFNKRNPHAHVKMCIPFEAWNVCGTHNYRTPWLTYFFGYYYIYSCNETHTNFEKRLKNPNAIDRWEFLPFYWTKFMHGLNQPIFKFVFYCKYLHFSLKEKRIS